MVAFTSSWSRRVFPVGVAFPAIDVFATQMQKRRAPIWKENVRFHEQLLRHTPLRGTEGEVARRAIREIFQCMEIFWRPWLMERGEIDGLETLLRAQREGRGVVTVFPHFGMVYAQFHIMRRFAVDAWVVGSSYHFEADGSGYDARFARRGRQYIDLLGRDRSLSRTRRTDGTESVYPRVLELLGDGATVSLAFDIAGGMPTPFLGRTLSLTGGPARLATATNALVVPFVVRRRGPIPVLRFGAQLDPRDFSDEIALQGAIADRMEHWALECPEAVWQLRPNHPDGPPLISGRELEALVPEDDTGQTIG
jgi:lauroyl/myristoyl acyltransferase